MIHQKKNIQLPLLSLVKMKSLLVELDKIFQLNLVLIFGLLQTI